MTCVLLRRPGATAAAAPSASGFGLSVGLKPSSATRKPRIGGVSATFGKAFAESQPKVRKLRKLDDLELPGGGGGGATGTAESKADDVDPLEAFMKSIKSDVVDQRSLREKDDDGDGRSAPRTVQTITFEEIMGDDEPQDDMETEATDGVDGAEGGEQGKGVQGAGVCIVLQWVTKSSR